ncbi:serine hydrolase [Mycolicibacterium sp. J2]|uniref:serine hydrolase n=1 Tax=Mycolicibacterium sp. J2 TaxID=2993511 RepID=UPI00224A5BAA|nr:serine hydrolase [Mycolicibacterium sp. J2]MCX2715666.1 serine hydrolase [Mycolicibacterium sp. J2]
MRRILLGVALVAVLAGCAAPRPADTPKPTPPGLPPPLVPAMPLPDNAIENAVGRLDGIAEELMRTSGIPGLAIAVVHGGKTVYAKGFGVKDNRAGGDAANKVGPDTVFQLASVSKPLSATVVARQVGEHAIGWDTPVVDKLPWFALSDPAVTRMVTVGDLLSHRSGLPDHAGDLLEDLGYDRRAVLQKLSRLPLDPFRISYAYTNFGFTAGAEAVAAAAGRPWEQLGQDALFGPLGMSSTSFRFADYQARKDRAVGHIRIDGGYRPEFVRDADQQAPAGGASSSVNDMTHWLAMVLANGSYGGRSIVDPKALLPALSPQVVSSPPAEPAMRTGSYGFGFNVGTTSGARVELSHSGAFELGAGSNILLLPSADVGIVALTNAMPSGVAEAITAEFADLVQFGDVREDWYALYHQALTGLSDPVGSLVGKQPPAHPAPAQPLPRYVGSYRNDYWGPAVVAEKNGGLTLTLGPRGDTVDLRHWDGDTFAFSFVSENSPPGSISRATFDGPKLTLEYYDEAVFTK